MQIRYTSMLVAALLPLLLFKWFVPTLIGQIDVWLMWIVAMIGVGLPLLYAEIGLAHRSQNTPAVGMQTLTRQADASVLWRCFSWVAVLLTLVIAALSIDAVSTRVLVVLQAMGLGIDIPDFALAITMVVIAAILSLLGAGNLLAALAMVAIAFAIGMAVNVSTVHLIMTEVSLKEWASVVVLALVSVGVGTGLYWFSNPVVRVVTENQQIAGASQSSSRIEKAKMIASKTTLPIWFAQLIVGSMALIFTTTAIPNIATMIYALGVLTAAAYFIYYASTQLATRFGRFGIWIATAVSLLVTAMLVLTTPEILIIALTILSLVSGLVLAIFSGWQMKISHMRKSLNFSSEGVYNIWRITIRIVTPLLIILAIVGWFV